ncbi:MAG TPA: hypothetical protein VF018_09445 [Acidobacteriaceae bacterium]
MSKKSKSYTGRKGKRPAKAKLPTCNSIVENLDRKWRLSLSPKETVIVAEDAPLLQMVIQNVGLAVFEVAVEDREPVLLMPNKLSLMLVYGKVTVENWDDTPGIADIEFLPRTKS